MKPLRALGKPIADVIGPHSFAGWQTALDPLLTPGARNYWKSHSFAASRGRADRRADRRTPRGCRRRNASWPSPSWAARSTACRPTRPPTRTATSQFLVNIHTRWRDAADDGKCIAWARSLFDAAAPFATGGTYVNFIPEDDTDGVRRAYLGNFERLAAIKAKYDPDNLFRVNQNIRPTP